MKIVSKSIYSGGDGVAVGIVKKAPKEAGTRADVICLIIQKGKIIDNRYLTPDEAMSAARGLVRAVDEVMHPYWLKFRADKDKK